MEKKEEIQKEISSLEKKLEPLKEQLNQIYLKEQGDVEEKIKRTEMLQDKFDDSELIYSAHSRCMCGAGFAYPKNIGFFGSWICSSILTGKADRGSSHSQSMPFSFYNIKSENQPSANGDTTRPS